MELRDIDVNEVEEPVESSPAETLESPEVAPEETMEEPQIVEPTTEKTEEVKPQEEVKEVEKQPDQPKPSRAEQRIRNLANENRELKAKIETFGQQPAPQFEGNEMTYDDLNKVINERAMQAAELIVASKQTESEYQRQVNTWATDFEQVKQENPALDPESPDYDAELDATLARLLDDGSGNPRVDILVSDVLKTITKRESTVQSKAKEEGKTQATVTLAKQMAESAITPTPQPASTQEELSEQEMAELRVKDPKEWMKRL